MRFGTRRARSVDRSPARPEDERLPLGQTYVYGLQHILTMYGGVIAPPLIVGGAAGLTAAQIGLLVSAALFVSGAATILQTVGVPFFGSQLPLVQGISFASVSTMVAVATGPGGLVAITGIKSRFVVAAGGSVLLTPGPLPVLGRVVAAVPQPVLGGAGIVLFGASGSAAAAVRRHGRTAGHGR